MYKRPTVFDTDEDILRQQQEFLKAAGKEPAIEKGNDKVEENDITATTKVNTSIGLIGDIIERTKCGSPTFIGSKLTSEPFPTVFRIDSTRGEVSSKKKSLFAQKLGRKSDPKTDCTKEILKPLTPVNKEDQLSLDVHKENSMKINNMSEEEILTEKKSLEGMLSPEMMNFLRSRGKKKELIPQIEEKRREPEEGKPVNIDEVKNNISMTMSKEWMELDKIEPEKLEWIGDIPDAKALEPDQPYSARFDFSGDLLPFKTEVDVRTSLHHHGDEPERAGYTIQELYQLARSSVLQQRIVALNVLANIIRKTKMGYYDECFDGALLPKLVDSDVFFLLRFAMDDRAVTPAAVNCLNEFFCCRPDEVCLDRLLNNTETDIEPTLFVPLEIDNDSEEAELKDHQILAQDIIKGVLRTDILIRFNYILREFCPDQVVKSKIFEVIVRICRHSRESCEAVLKTPGLLSYIFDNLLSSEPLYHGVKVLRVLASTSIDFAKTLLSSYSFAFILKFIDMDEPVFKMKLECLALWKTFLRFELLLPDFLSFTPCLSRLLLFYVEKVDSIHGRFDFELFAGIVSLINVVQSKKVSIDSSYIPVIQKCLKKWLIQIQFNSNCNYSVAKAIGCALRFFIVRYSIQGVSNSDIDFLKTLGPSIAALLKSEIFQRLSKELNKFSHLQKFKEVSRDPPNLPSLSAVYSKGADYVSFLNDSSSLPLFVSLSNFLLKLFEISHESKPLLEGFLFSIDNYLNKTLNSSTFKSWFNFYEVRLLCSAIEVHSKLSTPHALLYSFKCLPFFRSDDEELLKIVKVIFQNDFWPRNFLNIYSSQFFENFKEIYLYDCKNVERDWMYGPISKNTEDVLTLISTILKTSPELLSNVPPTVRYYRLCLVFLDEDNIFDAAIHSCLEVCLQDIVKNFDKIDLNIRVSESKSFYDLYTELVIQYAGTSYGNPLFAKFVTLPLAQKFDISFRKLLWSEYMHALRVIILPKDINDFLPVEAFASPVETDESLLVLYLNAISKNFLTPQRNGFIYSLAFENVRNYLCWPGKDERLSKFLIKKISEISNNDLMKQLLAEIVE